MVFGWFYIHTTRCQYSVEVQDAIIIIIIIKLRWALFVTYTKYNQQWNVFSAFNPYKYTHLEQWAHTHTHTHTHIWSSGHTHTPGAVGTHTHTSGAVDTHTPGAVGSPGSSWGFGALLKGLTSVVDNSCWSRGSNPQPRVTSPTLYPLEPQLSD